VLTCDIDTDTLRCRVCGAHVTRLGIVRHCGPCRPGLGDLAAGALAAVGITKDRVEAIVGGPCGCDERQAWMNAAGEKWLGLPPGTTAPPPVDPQG
jgi:hypothetical protein